MDNPQRGGVGGGAQRGAAVPAAGRRAWGGRRGIPPSPPPSVPAAGAGVGERPRSHPELGRTVGHGEGLYAAPTQVFAPCLSFPVGKQASSPPPRGRAGFHTIANLHVIILGAESSITQSQDC